MGWGPDGTAKTPAWAAAITGIPRERIIQLAREIGLNYGEIPTGHDAMITAPDAVVELLCG